MPPDRHFGNCRNLRRVRGSGVHRDDRTGLARIRSPTADWAPSTCHTRPVAVTVRLLAASEWPLWRDVTLRSLADSPDAFRPTLSEAQEQPEEFWRRMVAATVEHRRSNLWIAIDGDDAIGKLFAGIDDELTTVYIGAMWVAPDLRGEGTGRGLMHATERWGKDNGVNRSELWVTETNRAAVRFYESLDYLCTNATQTLRKGSELMVRKLQKTI